MYICIYVCIYVYMYIVTLSFFSSLFISMNNYMYIYILDEHNIPKVELKSIKGLKTNGISNLCI